MKIMVETLYKVYGAAEVELPEGKTRDDIKHIHMNWGKGSIEFKDGTSMNVIESKEFDEEGFKRPNTIKVTDEEGSIENEIEWEFIGNSYSRD